MNPIQSKQTEVDIHCHIFNATDFPGGEFINEVQSGVLDALPALPKEVFAKLVLAFIHIITHGAPDGVQELALLQTARSNSGGADASIARLMSDENDVSLIRDAKEKIEELRATADIAEQEAAQLLEDALAGVALGAEIAPHDAASIAGLPANTVPSTARFPDDWPRTALGGVVEFVRRARNYRFKNAVRMFELYGGAEGIRLICPAVVDYDYWLRPQSFAGEILDPATPHELQVEVMDGVSQVARRTESGAVHGYMAYDPLRDELEGGRSLNLVKSAVASHGFIGVKLYPPMGFQPFRNAGLDFFIPDSNRKRKWPADLGQRLDARLAALYQWCLGNDVPVLSHTNATVFPEPDYQYRPNPVYWAALLESQSRDGVPSPLRLMLGHFGGLSDLKACPEDDSERSQNERIRCWAEIIRSLCRQYPNVYTDLSFHQVILSDNDSPDRLYYVRMLAELLGNAGDPMRRKICYGSDWLMLSRIKGHPGYRERMEGILRDGVGLDEESVADVMGRNALRFLGILPSEAHGLGKNAERLRAYYATHNLSLPEWWPIEG